MNAPAIVRRHDACLYPSDWFDLLNPRPEQIHFGRLATRLARIHRFVGGTRWPYSVAQHSVNVANMVSAPSRALALLHDAHEAFIGDQIRPFLGAMDEILSVGNLSRGESARPATRAREELARRWDVAIFSAAGINAVVTPEMVEEVKATDYAICAIELETIVQGLRAPPSEMIGISEHAARREWLEALYEFTGIEAE